MARIHIQKKITSIVIAMCRGASRDLEIKISIVKALKNRITAYSAIKIRANPDPPYSVLNPETSSDSPSAKSKGVRLVSATQEVSHKNDNNTKGMRIRV